MKNDTQITERLEAYNEARKWSGPFMDRSVADSYMEVIRKGELYKSETFQSLKAARKEYNLINSKFSESRQAVQKIMGRIDQLEYQKKEAQGSRQVDRFFDLEAQESKAWRELKEAREELAIFTEQEKTAGETLKALEAQMRKEHQAMKAALEEQMTPHLVALNDLMVQIRFLGHQVANSGAANGGGELFRPYLAKYRHLNG
jgi:chromosome segregation ATPase